MTATLIQSPPRHRAPRPAPQNRRWLRGVVLFLFCAVIFLIYNYRAYGSYFFDDAFDHLTWTRRVNLRVFLDGLLTWRFLPNNFRPVAHYYYRLMYDCFGYRFPAWVAFLHIFHLTAVWLLWLIIRRLGAQIVPAAAGTMVFALNMSAFYVYWRPMFHFDLFCGLFILLSVFCYMRGQTILALIAFWLAYKSKEIGVAVPAILLLYEWWFGGRRWCRVLPFAAISASFIIQAFLHNRVARGGYVLHFRLHDVWTCVCYYADHVLFLPYLGFLLPVVLLLKRDRRIVFGLCFALCTLSPMFLLPTRLYDAYLYIPSAGLAIAAAFLLEACPKWTAAAFCAVWLGANACVLQQRASHELELAHHNRHFFEAAVEMARQHAEIHTVTFRNSPPEMAPWGVMGVFYLALPQAKVYWAEDPQAQAIEKQDGVAITAWDFDRDRLVYRITSTPAAIRSAIRFDKQDGLGNLNTGWYGREGAGFRWAGPKAIANLRLPDSAAEFYVEFFVAPGQIPPGGVLSVRANLAGQRLPPREFSQPDRQEAVWPLSRQTLAALAKLSGPDLLAPVTIETTPAYHPLNSDARTLGLAVTAFGFR